MAKIIRTVLASIAAAVIVSIPILLYILLWCAVGPVGFWQKAFMIMVPGAVVLIIEFPVVMMAITVFDEINN